ncbi:hypothetical protein BG011_000563 [Mortierella polycephala]|uniref:Uncharacterized protein n=1 Tax=Mortierella polycephala TaxID=41804 RepID=A0A9P6PIQ7_9FUNG|nr:hypothetical protein BG011_000563 [Mortierella polycephala]
MLSATEFSFDAKMFKCSGKKPNPLIKIKFKFIKVATIDPAEHSPFLQRRSPMTNYSLAWDGIHQPIRPTASE